MADSPVGQGRVTKKMKLAGHDFSGKIPKVFLDGENNIAKMVFHIHDFANRKEKRGERFFTGKINAHGHFWKLWINPQGSNESNADIEHVSIYLTYAGKNTETDSIMAKACIRTKSIDYQLKTFEFSNSRGKRSYGKRDFGKREDMIKKDCNEAGTLTVTVELQVATEKRSVWYPQLTSCDYTRLYKSIETSDVTVMVGTKEFQLHKNVLADRTRVLYELVRTEESSLSLSSSSSEKNTCIVVLADVDETAFEILIQFVYSGEEPNLKDLDEETMKSILVAANRLGVTELKLYVESLLVDKFLVPSKAAAFLLFADSYSCGYLKEQSMNSYITDSPTFMNSDNDDWKSLQESNKLLVELLVYAAADRTRYSSVVNDGEGTIEDVDEFDVTSLRERLQNVNLDVDGSREILVERWKEYVLANNNNNNNSNELITS